MSRHTSNDHPPPGRFLVQRRRHVWWMMRIILILLLLRLLLLVVPPSLVRRSSSSLSSSSSSFPSFFPKLPVTDSTLTTRIDQQQQQHNVLLQNATTVLCINDVPYGQTFNMLLTMATARILAYELSKNTSTVVKVGLGPTFSDFYLATLEPHDDVLTHYFSQKGWTILQTTPATTATTTNHSNMCHVEYRSKTLFELFFQPNWYTDTRRSIIQSLIPNANLRQQAVTYLQQQQRRRRRRRYPFSSHNDTLIITTVHRRNFEGTCEELVERGDHVACWDPRTGHPRNNNHSFLAPMELLNTICRRTYPMIQRDLNISQNRGIGNWMSRYFDSSDHHHHHHQRYIILLCTDRQVKKYDRTFPNWVSISPLDIPKDHPTYRPAVILIEAWIMTLSDIHYGVPMSTVDVVVNFWRNRPEWLVGPDTITQRGMRPVSCYGTTANDGNV